MLEFLNRILTPKIGALALVALTAAMPPAQAAAQNLFAPAIRVNDAVITNYEIDQRARMLQLLNAPGNPQEAAREALIEDRLRLQAARRAGIDPSPEDLAEAQAEFAGRANLSREEFIQALGQAGVAEETFRDFVRAGLSWRILVQQRFAGRANASESEIDRALSGGADGSNVRVLISEIIMPAPPPQAEAVRARANRIAQSTSEAEFSSFARQFSATASRGNGGRLPWQDLTELPPQLRPILLGLSPGEVSDPLPIPNAIALFQLRGIEETGYTAPDYAAIEYAAYYLPGGRTPENLARARVIDSRTDRCDDLYGIAKGQPESRLQRESLPPSELPTDIAFELSKLDRGEVSTALTRSGNLMVLMLCGRTRAVAEGQDREDLAMGLRNRRLNTLAEGYLAQLRADAYIVTE
ncbi:Chaperone SurA precursor [Roseivivax sp. THAF40]|uniref:peptidylprolyl isomerase n=1 Tax=unclassified Roseivivax TaxID=2639302 RepID=UPI001267A8B2|nr:MULTISPECIES: peptidylprolyl isomerase [unclassified Roseivivax]QFS82765.1 Chaperone SurA precursor [Roseivivax sp. THAF197b]QFT46534.1 Chaperone SurA precursor [Roseivivax sp. THAF40]